MANEEKERLFENDNEQKLWHRWGPYLSERQWGTVREDYSPHGTSWDYLTHDQSRSRAYRWGEDGIAGISDRHGLICFALTLWNEIDPILKERLFGLTNSEGNHGEDVKEYYFYLDNTPTHSYMKYLYKYPQAEFPYSQLVNVNRSRSKDQPEYELMDTRIFDENRYFDVIIEYGKFTPEDIAIRITAINRGDQPAPIHLLPTLWAQNTWSWGNPVQKPELSLTNERTIKCITQRWGERHLYFHPTEEVLFTENDTNNERLFQSENASKFVKDGFHAYLCDKEKNGVNPDHRGTKAAPHYHFVLEPGESKTIHLRFTDQTVDHPFDEPFEAIFLERQQEANEFYNALTPGLTEDQKNIQRQAFAGMLWSKQYFHYDVATWLKGDPGTPPPPEERLQGRNCSWKHFYAEEVLSMPDKWEYPWFASWDLAFHCLPLALIDPSFAKNQLKLLLREWYMKQNGQIPAYEWSFDDVNPPVHAWAAWRVYTIDRKMNGKGDTHFLECIFHKLLLNFTWWVNRKDISDNNVFEGGFLGLDNIGVFDRNSKLPDGSFIEQSDGTSWMAMYCLNMLTIALELARHNHSYEDVASKFFEHFIVIAQAMNTMGEPDIDLWDEEDGFYYDVLHKQDGSHVSLKVRSGVGLIPLFAAANLNAVDLEKFPGFKKRLDWFLDNRPQMTSNINCTQTPGHLDRRLLSVMTTEKLRRVLEKMLDENEFLSPYGLRALSKIYEDNPYNFELGGETFSIDYEPGESTSGLFGGNSNWRGPIWFPLNYLMIESLQKYHYYFGDSFKVECPKGSGKLMNLWEVSLELESRLTSIFLKTEIGRPVYGNIEKFQTDPYWKDLIQFHEYFHGDSGRGVGASHQTGWTGLVAKLIQQLTSDL